MTTAPAIRRVLMTADTVGGVWTYALDLIRGLNAGGVHVDLATMGAPVQPAQRAELRALGDAVTLHESGFRLEWMEDPWADVARAGEWLLELERACAPDVIHLNGYAHAALSWQAPVLVVAHSCVWSWWRAVKKSPPPTSWSRYHAAVRRGLAHANLVVAPTQAMLDALEENYGALPHSRVIHNGREPPGSTDSPKREIIFSVGRLWDEAKNAQALAAAAPHLPWPVRLAGHTRGPDGGEAVLPGVELLGHCATARLAAEYGAAGIYALPARYEPFGLSVLEAAHAGCALVLGEIPSLRELWSGAAVFVSPDDTVALRLALQGLIAQPERRSALGREARRRATRYTSARMTAGYFSAYTELVTPARPAPAALATSFA